jgi:hypothetical protein
MPYDARLARRDAEITQLTVAAIVSRAAPRGRAKAPIRPRVRAVRRGIGDGLRLDCRRIRTPAPDEPPRLAADARRAAPPRCGRTGTARRADTNTPPLCRQTGRATHRHRMRDTRSAVDREPPMDRVPVAPWVDPRQLTGVPNTAPVCHVVDLQIANASLHPPAIKIVPTRIELHPPQVADGRRHTKPAPRGRPGTPDTFSRDIEPPRLSRPGASQQAPRQGCPPQPSGRSMTIMAEHETATTLAYLGDTLAHISDAQVATILGLGRPSAYRYTSCGNLRVQRTARDVHPPLVGTAVGALFNLRATHKSTAAPGCRERPTAVYRKALQYRGNARDEIATDELFDVDLFHMPACGQHSLADAAELGGAGDPHQHGLSGGRRRLPTSRSTSAGRLTLSVPLSISPPVQLRVTAAAITARPGSDK